VFVCLKLLLYEWFWQWLFSSVFGHEIVYCVFAYLNLYFVCLFYWNCKYMWMVVWMFIYEYLHVIWNCNHVFVEIHTEDTPHHNFFNTRTCNVNGYFIIFRIWDFMFGVAPLLACLESTPTYSTQEHKHCFVAIEPR